MKSSNQGTGKPTPDTELHAQLMDSRIPKSEREYYASRRITELEAMLKTQNINVIREYLWDTFRYIDQYRGITDKEGNLVDCKAFKSSRITPAPLRYMPEGLNIMQYVKYMIDRIIKLESQIPESERETRPRGWVGDGVTTVHEG